MEELPNLLSADVVSQIGDIGFEGRLRGEGRCLCMMRGLLRLPLLTAVTADATSRGCWEGRCSCREGFALNSRLMISSGTNAIIVDLV